jgi:hypothetical protein
MILATTNHPYLRVRRHINLYHPFVSAELIARIFSFFSPVRFVSAQLVSPPPFLLLGAAFPPANIVTPPHRVTLSSH